MINIIEIPVLAAQQRQKELFFGNMTIKEYSNTAGFKYGVYEISEDMHVYFYLIENFLESQDLSVYDRIIPKASFSWLLFDFPNHDVDTLLKKYTKCYSTPLFKVAPGAFDDSLKEKDEPIEDSNVLYYDSQIQDPVRQVLQLSLNKYQNLDLTANSTFAG